MPDTPSWGGPNAREVCRRAGQVFGITSTVERVQSVLQRVQEMTIVPDECHDVFGRVKSPTRNPNGRDLVERADFAPPVQEPVRPPIQDQRPPMSVKTQDECRQAEQPCQAAHQGQAPAEYPISATQNNGLLESGMLR
jgi:hypothetical protein